jgi:hypothetical protein
MASLVQRRDKRADIDNRRQYLQLFACQRAAPLYRWWYSLAIDTKHDLLKSWGIPERPINEPTPRFPAHFHVDELLKADDQAPVTQPPLYAPLDGVLRTFAIVADPLTKWAPRVSDASVDWLDTLTAICEALADEYVDRTLDDGASPVMLPSKVSERVREHWLPESWDRSKLQQRFFPDETLTDVACPASRSLRRHRDALCLAHRKDAVRALEQALALGLCEDDEDRSMVASALALLADSVAWTSQGFLTEREARAVAAAGEKVYERIASYSAHCRPHQLLFLKALCLLQKQTANVAETFGDFFVLADDEAQMLHRTYASDDRRAQDRGATILVAVARAHIAFGIAKGDEDGGVERALAMRDWEIDVACGWHARRGLRRFRRGDDEGALQDLDKALCGLSPDDAEFAACCAIMAILMKRAGDEGRGARYLEVAKHGGACPELELAREAFGEASAADAEPDGVTRIVGSRVPKVLRTPRVDDLVDEARE